MGRTAYSCAVTVSVAVSRLFNFFNVHVVLTDQGHV